MLSRAASQKYLEGAMRSICDLMVSRGIPKKSAERLLNSVIERAYSGERKLEIESKKISQLADVCTRWQFEREFVDRAGQPKPLRWNGKQGSLLRLARIVVGTNAAQDVIEALINKRLIRRLPDGTWIPKSRVVAPSGFENAQILRSSKMIDRLLRTVTYNSVRKYRGEVLLEVMAQVPRLPSKEIRKFKKFSKAQGLIFAKSVDDWLEARSLRRSQRNREPSIETGVVAFAFIDPHLPKARRGARS